MVDVKNVKCVVGGENFEVYEMEKGGKIICVVFGFDGGESLGSVEVVEKKEGGEFGGFGFNGESLEDVFSSEEVEWLWDMGWCEEENEG